jgi:hypothetical protein
MAFRAQYFPLKNRLLQHFGCTDKYKLNSNKANTTSQIIFKRHATLAR